ncbi:jg882, partial [Pararge aegeria aegeria]
EAEEWARRQSGPMVNPSFEPDDFLPQRYILYNMTPSVM